MRTPLAWYNLVHDWFRTVVAVAGVAFAVVLIFLQLGTYGAVLRTATLIYSRLDYDIMLYSKDYFDFTRPASISLSRVAAIQDLPGVARLSPFYISYVPWRNPVTLQRRAILMMAYRPDDVVFTLPDIRRHNAELKRPDTVLMDRMSRPEFGPQQVGLETDCGRQRVHVVGLFTMGTGFGADGAIVTSAATFGRIFAERSPDEASMGLVKLAPGAKLESVIGSLRQTLPADVQVLSRREVEQREQRHWAKATSVGVVLAVGLGVAVIVGVAIVYQVLASNIAAHLAEYATLKAMGYSDAMLSWMVIQQALVLATVGFVPGFAASSWLYDFVRGLAHIPIGMTWVRFLIVLAGSFAMCALAAVLSLRKVYLADPAELF